MQAIAQVIRIIHPLHHRLPRKLRHRPPYIYQIALHTTPPMISRITQPLDRWDRLRRVHHSVRTKVLLLQGFQVPVLYQIALVVFMTQQHGHRLAAIHRSLVLKTQMEL